MSWEIRHADCVEAMREMEEGWLERAFVRARRNTAYGRRDQCVDEIERLQRFVRALVEVLAVADHRRLGEVCGVDACVLCWLEGQGRELLPDEGVPGVVDD